MRTEQARTLPHSPRAAPPDRFRDRHDAGRELARRLASYGGRHDVVVLGLPRGGVPVAFEVARALRSPLDVIVVRKLGVPGDEELAMGAIASGGVVTLNGEIVNALGIPTGEIWRAAAREEKEVVRQEEAYRRGWAPPDLRGRVVVLVDDGFATGASVRAALAAIRSQNPRHVIAAAPVGAAEVCAKLRGEVDELVCARIPRRFYSVGELYEDFAEVGDEEVNRLLQEAAA